MQYFSSGKTFRFADLIRIPFKLNPLWQLLKLMDVLLYAMLPTFQALLTANVVDYSLLFLKGEDVKAFLLLNFVALVLCIAGEYLNDLAMTYIDKKNEIAILTKYQEATIRKRSLLKYQYIENEKTRDLIARVCTQVDSNKFIKGYNNIIRIVSLGVTTVSLIVVVSNKIWWLGILILIISAPLFFLSVKIGGHTYEESKEAVLHEREAEYLQNVLRNRESVDERSLFTFSEFVNDLWYKKYEIVRKIKLKIELKYLIKLKSAGVVTATLSFLILCSLLYPLYRGDISIGLFMALAVAFIELVNTISWNLVDITRELASSNAYMKDLSSFFQLEEIEQRIDKNENIRTRTKIKKIVFNDVSFKYPFSNRYILKHFTYEMDCRKTYAIVGKNGAGKTTLTKLLLGLYDDYEGEIYLDEIELRNFTPEELKNIFSVVFQDFAKYEVSLKDNIICGDKFVYNENRYMQAINALQINDFLNTLPQQDETMLGRLFDTAVDLSGGQWQKVGIARTMYSNAPIQILDEPTASLDPVAESNIYKMFKKASTGKMMLIITHRLGAARIADSIIVVENGCVMEAGSHQDLLKLNGVYAEMYMTQKSWYENEE